MSTTSGPTEPENTGNSSVLPSGSLKVAVLSAMASFSGGAKAGDDFAQVGRIFVAAPDDDIPEVVVGEVEQLIQVFDLIFFHAGKKFLENKVQLQQPSSAFPPEPV